MGKAAIRGSNPSGNWHKSKWLKRQKQKTNLLIVRPNHTVSNGRHTALPAEQSGEVRS
jgi:hypothetical protein